MKTPLTFQQDKDVWEFFIEMPFEYIIVCEIKFNPLLDLRLYSYYGVMV